MWSVLNKSLECWGLCEIELGDPQQPLCELHADAAVSCCLQSLFCAIDVADPLVHFCVVEPSFGEVVLEQVLEVGPQHGSVVMRPEGVDDVNCADGEFGEVDAGIFDGVEALVSGSCWDEVPVDGDFMVAIRAESTLERHVHFPRALVATVLAPLEEHDGGKVARFVVSGEAAERGKLLELSDGSAVRLDEELSRCFGHVFVYVVCWGS